MNRYFGSLDCPQARATTGTWASSSSRIQRRTFSSIPDDFDIDTDLPGSVAPAKVETVPASPFPESATMSVDDNGTDWSRSYHGLSETPFEKDIRDILLAPINPEDVEMKPGILGAFHSRPVI